MELEINKCSLKYSNDLEILELLLSVFPTDFGHLQLNVSHLKGYLHFRAHWTRWEFNNVHELLEKWFATNE